MSRWQRWWIAFALMAAAAAVSYAFLDRPIAFFAHDHLRGYKLFARMTKLPESFNAIGTGIALLLGATILYGRPLARWQTVALTWSVSVFSTSIIKNQFKIAFGRTWPETWVQNNPSLIRDGVYGFFPFHGGDGFEAFPSGHTAAICAAMTVLWICYPRYRAVYALLVLAVAVGLIGANYHFLSDIIAGGFLGTSVAMVAVQIAGLMPASPAARPAATPTPRVAAGRS